MKIANELERIIAINHPFNSPEHDKRPLREFVAGAWPTWGEFKEAVNAYAKLRADNKALLDALKVIVATPCPLGMEYAWTSARAAIEHSEPQ